MIKKFMYSALAVASISAGLVSCNPTAKDGSATQDSVAKEEVHNLSLIHISEPTRPY